MRKHKTVKLNITATNVKYLLRCLTHIHGEIDPGLVLLWNITLMGPSGLKSVIQYLNVIRKKVTSTYKLFVINVGLPCLFLCPQVVSSVHGPPEKVHGSQKVKALVGGDILLPCFFNITASGDLPTVKWSKKVLEHRTVVFLYQDGCETERW